MPVPSSLSPADMFRSVDVICVGSAKYDSLVRVDHRLEDDERVVTDRILSAAGGNANTAAAAVARMGVSVAVCVTLGQDIAGDFLVAQMDALGIATDYVTRRADLVTPQSVNIANSATDTRTIITTDVLPFDAGKALSAAPRWFHLDAEGFRVAQEAVRTGALRGKVSVDAGISIETDDLTGIDLYAPTEAAIVETFGGTLETAMRRAAKAGARDVVVTRGGRGAAVLQDGEILHVPAFKVEVVSTLGAGDVFHGALVARLVQGEALVDAVRAASVCAALACRGLDAQSAIPTLAELTEHLDGFAAPVG